MGEIFFTSDLHFMHDREFIWGPRGFKDVYEMNEAIIARLDAIEAKIAAVLAATGTDNGKTLQIDSNGKVALVTV